MPALPESRTMNSGRSIKMNDQYRVATRPVLRVPAPVTSGEAFFIAGLFAVVGVIFWVAENRK